MNPLSPNCKIALAGNPNSGKTSLFNRITGAMQKVGNWGGVTVDIKEGTKKIGNKNITFIDLPGTYSLSAFSEEERVARNYIIQEKPDIVITVLDGTNLDRHLYLTVQLMEMGIRPILAINMWDEVTAKKISIDIPTLSSLLGLTVIPTSARTGEGIDRLIDAAMNHMDRNDTRLKDFSVTYPAEVEDRIQKLSHKISTLDTPTEDPRWAAIKIFEHDPDVEKLYASIPGSDTLFEARDTFETEVNDTLGDEPASFIAESRYGYISGVVKESISTTRMHSVETSDNIDAVLTHRFWAYPIFLLFMWLLFQATFKIGEHPMAWIESFVTWLGIVVQQTLPEGAVQDLIVDGVIAGVGGVIVFLPNILILFFGISIMEDTGYMARAAFIMDRLMHRIGLHGKSFIPMIMGLGCSVPAIMAARTLESRDDRIKTILLTPLVSCSARLPVFVLFAGALFPKHAGNVVFLFQVVFGFGAFCLMALVFKKTLFRKTDETPFVMELPPYRIPTVRSVIIHMWHKAEHYLKKMGGVVLVFSVILWWAGIYPKSPEIEKHYETKIEAVESMPQMSELEKEERITQLRAQQNAAVMKNTYIGTIGEVLEPVVKPFGSDWRGAVSLVTGFVAKEIVVGSMGVLYAVGDEVDEASDALRGQLVKHFTPLSGFAFMLFVLLYTPCVVALITVVRELHSWKWSVFSVAYQLALAWGTATVVYQIGRVFSG